MHLSIDFLHTTFRHTWVSKVTYLLILSNHLTTCIGLITFQSTAKISLKITHAVENFRHKVYGMSTQGDTALWDAISLASDQIVDYTKKFPNAKRRIICLSDGKDNMSKKKHSDLSIALSVSGNHACKLWSVLIL